MELLLTILYRIDKEIQILKRLSLVYLTTELDHQMYQRNNTNKQIALSENLTLKSSKFSGPPKISAPAG